MEIERPGSPAESVRLPRTGLAIDFKTQRQRSRDLLAAVTGAFYGADPRSQTAASGKIRLHVGLGMRELFITRDLSTGAIRVLDGAGVDRTTSHEEARLGRTIGEQLLHLSRQEFETLCLVRHEGLGGEHARGQLLQLLNAEADAASGKTSDSDSALRDEAPSPTEAHDLIVAEVRAQKAELDRLSGLLDTKATELRIRSNAFEELRAENERVSSLSEVQSQDTEKLGNLIEILRRSADRKEALRKEEVRFQQDLKSRGISVERLTRLEQVFETMDQADLAFLESYRKTTTIHRGNQALVKSEGRLDEARLLEISRLRNASSNQATWPFVLSVFWILGSISLQIFGVPGIWAALAVFFAVGSAGLGLTLFWRAKSLREPERRETQESLQRKSQQLAELDKEQCYAAGRLGVLADACSVPEPREILDLYDEWKTTRGDHTAVLAFAKRREEFDREVGSIREKLGSFSSSTASSGTAFGSVAEWETLHRDYIRVFEIKRELQEAQQAVIHGEEELASIEVERSDLQRAIEEILTGAGIDATKDLEEAIERLALRAWSSPVRPPERASTTTQTTWQAPLSARVEAIVRRFLPEVRELEFDSNLDYSVKLETRGPRLTDRDLEGRENGLSTDIFHWATRIAVWERLNSRVPRPLLVEDPLVRWDDARYDRALKFLAEDVAASCPVLFSTVHEVRTRWVLHNHPELAPKVALLGATTAPQVSAAATRPAAGTPRT